MSWIKIFTVAALNFAFLNHAHADANMVCPARPNHPLRYVDVFDGEKSELATLQPDVAKDSRGYWNLGYVYDQGRSVTFTCKYADKKVIDVKIANRVNRCDYKINSAKTLSISCQ